MAGCVDGKTQAPLIAHIFVDEKGDYYSIDGDAPRYSSTIESGSF
jgi:hypothetical protein